MADLISTAAQSFAWVVVGAWVSPRFRSHTAVALCAVYVTTWLLGMLITQSDVPWTDGLFLHAGTVLGLVGGVSTGSSIGSVKTPDGTNH